MSGYVRLACAQTIQLAEGRQGSGLSQVQAEQAYGIGLAALIDPERFPDAAGFLTSGLGEAESGSAEDPDFEFGLNVILNGVATLIEAT